MWPALRLAIVEVMVLVAFLYPCAKNHPPTTDRIVNITQAFTNNIRRQLDDAKIYIFKSNSSKGRPYTDNPVPISGPADTKLNIDFASVADEYDAIVRTVEAKYTLDTNPSPTVEHYEPPDHPRWKDEQKANKMYLAKLAGGIGIVIGIGIVYFFRRQRIRPGPSKRQRLKYMQRRQRERITHSKPKGALAEESEGWWNQIERI